MNRILTLWLCVATGGALLLPWYALDAGFWQFGWLTTARSADTASATQLVLQHGRLHLAPLLACLAAAIIASLINRGSRPPYGLIALLAAVAMVMTASQGFLIGRPGGAPIPEWLDVWGASGGQVGLGAGAFVVISALLFVVTSALAGRAKGGGDAFVYGLIGAITLLVATFVFLPIGHILIQAFDAGGIRDSVSFTDRFFNSKIWGLGCIVSDTSCGAGINSLLLATATGIGTTVLGLAFALIATRTDFRAKRLLRVLTILPIITPPFVIGLALILLFGRTGAVTEALHVVFDIEKTRWLYGFQGVFLAQLLSFTPIAFLVMFSVVEGVSPSMEEASQTMRASRWQTFRHVSLPLMRPGLANAFLLGFIESLADFGNPLVLGGNFNVLSTEIYFAIVGAVGDSAMAATLAIVLLTLTFTAFIAQRLWLGSGSFATITGKADSGQHCRLSPAVARFCYATAIPWALFTAIVYGMIIVGSFVTLWGYDNSFTLQHYQRAFGFTVGDGLFDLRWTGVAWDSYFTTLGIASLAAPLTALVGLTTAYLLVRQRFAGKDAFEFSTMLSFAIPGTVVGVSYILAFNEPPIELTGTGLILIIVFIFRNMPVGVRGGIAAMSQLDKSLDEASLTLGANSFQTVRRVLMPLLGPAMLAALIYSFVRAITSVSAVIFLVSARHNMATSFIVGRVENGEFGIAIAYSAVLIITMLIAIGLLQWLIGQRRLRRERPKEAPPRQHTPRTTTNNTPSVAT